MAFGEAHSFGDALESVAEGAMTDIMQECGQQDNSCTVLVKAPLSASDDLDELARCVIDANAMSESAVCGAGVDQIGESELTDASQSPKLGGVEQVPRDAVSFVLKLALPFAEDDQPVDRVADAPRLSVVVRPARHA